ncbi:hypothetical protein FPV67DRAFT_928005 [Lyophyllum atratum]|nr:hypothetical protein FPV67DRAFT_928005 [Lyophyllum atratum]
MISRALQLQRAIDVFVTENLGLSAHKLHPNDWERLRAYSKILAVAHAFQQKLSCEKIPTLCEALPSWGDRQSCGSLRSLIYLRVLFLKTYLLSIVVLCPHCKRMTLSSLPKAQTLIATLHSPTPF